MLLVVGCMAQAADARMEWRGLHVDVPRHFFGVDVLEPLIERMAALKYNRLHLHLTDGPGWRLEIKSYPRLTSVGAWRKRLPAGKWNWQLHEIGSHFADSHLYFDYPQRHEEAEPYEHVITVDTVREFQLPALPHVLGMQGNVWTEHIRTSEQLFYMAFPRAEVLAEKFKAM